MVEEKQKQSEEEEQKQREEEEKKQREEEQKCKRNEEEEAEAGLTAEPEVLEAFMMDIASKPSFRHAHDHYERRRAVVRVAPCAEHAATVVQ